MPGFEKIPFAVFEKLLTGNVVPRNAELRELGLFFQISNLYLKWAPPKLIMLARYFY
jgi:hypothetical protein